MRATATLPEDERDVESSQILRVSIPNECSGNPVISMLTTSASGLPRAHRSSRRESDGDGRSCRARSVVSYRRQNYNRVNGLSVHKDSDVVAIRIGREHVKELAGPLVGRREGNQLLPVANVIFSRFAPVARRSAGPIT
jgi:hypothetical protein